MKKASFHHSGFSLLELSVVLVIISLIAGGVVFGKNLVRQAAVRSVVTDALKYQSAVQLFRDTYNALPGDFSTATSLWGAAAACMPTADFSGTATCNGNGNGRLFINDL
ncbi:MAG: prepilin-type N-terminal cleavage/methylation domain-containing protein, partial [Rickettsiales bacterium]|nr:prepilin-type N-terminal cleavage/methylation domain-containing protein [Rickettsiales bacterium]